MKDSIVVNNILKSNSEDEIRKKINDKLAKIIAYLEKKGRGLS